MQPLSMFYDDPTTGREPSNRKDCPEKARGNTLPHSNVRPQARE